VRVLIVGSGGREHALAWKAAQSRRLARLFVAPGNAGTAGMSPALPVENVPIAADDTPALVAFTRAKDIDLVIVGAEGPLAAGLADALGATGVNVLGPSAAAAQIEASKAFAKAFMTRHGLPTARYVACDSFESARAFVRSADFPVVIKASGLAAGKGVILPDNLGESEEVLRRIMLEREFGAAGDWVVIEERLAGPEVSLLAFTDGATVRPMPPAQDHKNLLDGDAGPNTGGMGAYTPAPICPPAMADDITRQILQPAVDGLRDEGRPFAGVLYAGLMLTSDGPRVLEFNCRLGDPETQAILPLLNSDLLDIAEACAEGRLAEVDIHWKAGATACVVMASEGYPGKSPLGRPIRGLEGLFDSAVVFHAGTKRVEGQVVTAGGRVLGVTGWGKTLPEALGNAYGAAERISFQGQHFRRDIGHRALQAAA
jgi:phosphoribosylamine--glycine ligase